MRGAIFVDTSAWFALVDESDEYHTRAVAILRRILAEHRSMLTTNHVASETYTLLRARIGSRAAHAFLRRTRDSHATRRLFVSEAWEEAAEDLLAQYEDQDFSYVDATSFIAMQRLGIQEAFTFDHHFAVLGFIRAGAAE